MYTAALMEVNSCSFSRNSAAGDGGGLYLDTSGALTPHEIRNCILYENSDAGGMDVEAQYYVLGAVELLHCCIDEWPTPWPDANGNTGDNPDFINAAADNLLIATTSPCIDTGDEDLRLADEADLDVDTNTSEFTPLDLGLRSRVVDGDLSSAAQIDMGAFELLPRLCCFEDIYPPNNPAICGDGDGIVNAGDLGELLANWGVCLNCCADIAPVGAPDQLVDAADLGEILASWGQCNCGEGFGGGNAPNGAGGSDGASDDAGDDAAAFYEWALNATIEELMIWLETGQWGG